jgi:hypothetical protein
MDIRLDDPSVSEFHAELIRRGSYVYVQDGGLSANGTLVRARPVLLRRVLFNDDVISFGAARLRAGGIPAQESEAAMPWKSRVPELTRREAEVLALLCRPALSANAFEAPATAHDIAAGLVMTEAAVKQHLLRLYSKFRIAAGPDRRMRLANKALALGIARQPDALAANGENTLGVAVGPEVRS